MSTRAVRAMGDVLTDADKKVAAIVGTSAEGGAGSADGLPLPARHERFWPALQAAWNMAEESDWVLTVTALEAALHEAKVRALEARADAAGVVR